MTTETLRQRNLTLYICLAAVTLAVYWPVSHFPFVNFDDGPYITQNPHLQDGLTFRSLQWALTTPLDQWMPVTWLVRILEYQWFGLNGGPHHLVNLLFHIGNTLLLFSVLNRMTRVPWRSALVAALFALHPLHVEAVAWVTGLKDVLSMFFWLLAIWGYVRYTEELTAYGSGFRVRGSRFAVGGSPLHAPPSTVASSAKAERSTLRQTQGRSPIAFYALTLCFFALALMSKPMVVTLPFVLLLLDYWPLGRVAWAKAASGKGSEVSMGRLLTEKVPFFGLAAVASAVTFWAQRGAAMVVPLTKMTLGLRISNVALAYVGYVGQTVWPMKMAVFYPLDVTLSLWSALFAGLGLIGVTVAVMLWARRAPWFVTGWFWYLGTLVPVIGFVQVGYQSMADRYTYIPLVGLFIMLVWGVPSRFLERRTLQAVAGIATGVALAACAILSRIQVGYWKDTETLFYHALKVTRGNWLALNNLGAAMGVAGRTQEAVRYYEEALRIQPHYTEARYNLGLILEHKGNIKEAIDCYEQVLQANPDYTEAHNNLGNVLARQGRIQDAMAHWEQALRINPDFAEAHNNLGVALWRTGRVPEAINHYKQALRIKPDFAEAHNNLGNALYQAGRLPEAIAHWQESLQLKPGNAEIHNNLGLALEQSGKLPEAVAQYEQAVRINPNYAKAHYNLGVALEKAGRTAEAISHYEQALRIQPNMTAAQEAIVRLNGG